MMCLESPETPVWSSGRTRLAQETDVNTFVYLCRLILLIIFELGNSPLCTEYIPVLLFLLVS